MSVKRFIFFLLSICFYVGIFLLLPLMEEQSLKKTRVNAVPNATPYGYKGLLLLLDHLQEQPVSFWEHSVMNLPLDTPKTIWFIEPGRGLFFDSPHYKQRLNTLVESGYHFVFILNENSLRHSKNRRKITLQGETPLNTLDYLNDWFDLSLSTTETAIKDSSHFFFTTSHFKHRTIGRLAYEKPTIENKYAEDPKIRKKLGPWFEQIIKKQQPTLLSFHKNTLPNNATALLQHQDDPSQILAVQLQKGDGSITLMPNSFFFKNGQLKEADNAALAIALQEQLPAYPIFLEGYSVGFRDNKNLLTYLATGKGLPLLVSLGTLFICFCLWLANRPTQKKTALLTSDERYYTQEDFIAALGKHYQQSNAWHDLYMKLHQDFFRDLEQRYPGHPPKECLQIIAESPFVDVSLKELQAISPNTPIQSEALFLDYFQKLLAIQRKVFHHDISNPSYPRSHR